MIAARHSTVSANAAYQQHTTKSECNRYATLGIERNKVSETSVPTIKSTSTTPTTNLTQDSMYEVTTNMLVGKLWNLYSYSYVCKNLILSVCLSISLYISLKFMGISQQKKDSVAVHKTN